MNPAVGVTKILNNLQECIDIVNEINHRNTTILPLLKDIKEFTELKDKIVNILKDGKLDKISRLAEITEVTVDKISAEKFSQMVEDYVTYHKNFLKEFDSTLENSLERIKNIKGTARCDWFSFWPKNEMVKNCFSGIVTGFCNWEYPVMEIFPGTGDMLPQALSAEPLYIVDWDQKLLENVSKQFNDYYANKRLMQYTINDYDLSALPQNSFGFVYCLNFLNFENIENITTLAKNVYNCLLPGGVYVFVYNNSDLWWSVENSANHYFGLVDGKQLKNNLLKVGYEIVEHTQSQEMNTSYFVCKKPGEIEYIKNSSILANIIDKPEDLK